MKYRIEICQIKGDKSWVDSGLKPVGQKSAMSKMYALHARAGGVHDAPLRVVVLVEGCEPSVIFVHDPKGLLAEPKELPKGHVNATQTQQEAATGRELAYVKADEEGSKDARLLAMNYHLGQLKDLGFDHAVVIQNLKDDLVASEKERKRITEAYGDIEQSQSDNAFHMKPLFERMCVAFRCEPLNTTWFEIADRVEAIGQDSELFTRSCDAYGLHYGSTSWEDIVTCLECRSTPRPF